VPSWVVPWLPNKSKMAAAAIFNFGKKLWTGKMFVWPPAFLSGSSSARYSSTTSLTTVSDLTIRLNTTTSLKSISLSQKLWLYHQLFKRSSDQFNLLDVNNVANHSSFSLVNRLQLTDAVTVIISSVHRHRLFIFSEINNGWSMTVTVLQLKASTQLIGLLLVPAIKGAVYINTHSI